MGNSFPSSVANDCCIVSSYCAFQDRAWLYFLSSLEVLKTFINLPGSCLFSRLRKPISPSFYSQGKVLQTPEHLGGPLASFLHWGVQNWMHYPQLSFLVFFRNLTLDHSRVKNGNTEHVTGLSTNSCSKKSVCLWLYSLFTTLPCSS